MMFLLGCVLPDVPNSDKEDDTATGDTAPVALLCEEPVEPACVDDMIQELSFQDGAPSEGTVETERDGDDFVTLVDATAGGSSASDSPWVYVRFGADGAERVDIHDEDSLEDMTWHLALRRYILRLNSGDGGPSCVLGAALRRDDYADVDAVPDDVDWLEEDFYDDDCVLRPDLLGGPETVMNGWWTYSSCVETTKTPYLLQLEDGTVLKVLVEAYYADDGQAECEEEGSTREEAGWIALRWRAL